MKRGDVVGGRFEVEELAGAGAMGVVYRARDRGNGEPVALKVLRPGAEMHRFARETRLLAELHHPGIVRYVAHGSSEEGPYLAMEWLEGISLADRLRHAELPLGDAIAVVARAAAAIGAAHRRWIVHRDLKPSNLFLVGGGLDRIKVLDFGVARHGALSSDLTRTGMMIGSPRYMAPEQVTAGKDVDARADVWALGVVLFRCTTGALPYGDAPTELLLAEVLTSVAPRARSVRPDIPEELDALIASMLSRDPIDRPPDGEAVARALGELTAAEAAAPQSRAPERQVLTLAEQRFACTLLVIGAEHRAVSELVKPHGGSAFETEDGQSAVTFTARGTATDLLQQSARAALAASQSFESCRIALVTGIAEGTASSRPEPDLLSRARALLARGDLQGRVLVDATSAALLDVSFDLDKAADGSAVLRGARRQVAPLRRLLGRATPCVGRERELSTLQALYEECVDEPVARVVLVTGAAGVGKSRLRYELLRRIVELPGSAPPAIWIGRGDPTRAGAPFGLLASALADGLEVQATSSQHTQREQVARRVAELVPEADVERITFNVAQTLGLRSDEADTLQGLDDPLLVGDEMRTAFEDLGHVGVQSTSPDFGARGFALGRLGHHSVRGRRASAAERRAAVRGRAGASGGSGPVSGFVVGPRTAPAAAHGTGPSSERAVGACATRQPPERRRGEGAGRARHGQRLLPGRAHSRGGGVTGSERTTPHRVGDGPDARGCAGPGSAPPAQSCQRVRAGILGRRGNSFGRQRERRP